MAQCVRFLLPLAVIAALVTAGCGGGDSFRRPVGAGEEIPANELSSWSFL